MNYDRRIIEAFRSNNITRILLIDDAYDPPELNERILPDLAEFLDSDVGKTTCTEYGITEDILHTATSAANDGNYDSEDLYRVYDVLYKNFVEELHDKFDPGGIFKLRKEIALQGLNPLYNLLCNCVENSKVHTAGLKDGIERYNEANPQVLFVDYYLSDDVPPAGEIKPHKKTKARKASIDLLKQIIGASREEDIPAIILMSSYEGMDIDKYRHTTNSHKIMSLRFRFLKKEMVKYDGTKFTIDHPAADALLDTSQGYRFGKALEQVLTQWKEGAESALSSFIREVGNLDIKDIAYLLRFRLREEGQPLSEYLQWFFGECLKGFIDEKVDWQHESFSALDEDDIALPIEGSFEGPSDKIAEFFDRVKLDRHRKITRRGYQLGDLYAKSGENDIRAILTPNSDLIKRNGEPKVTNILTMGGTLNSFEQGDSAADDFFLHKKKAYSVLWKPKDLVMFPISGNGELHTANGFDFVGTLRPLYALEMQHRVIDDLSRVGLPVAPALGINASFKVWIRKNNTKTPFHEIEIKQYSHATLIPARRGQRANHLVLLKRSFFNELINRLRQINKDEMCENDAKSLKKALKQDGMENIYNKFLIKGVRIKDKGPCGIGFIISDQPNSKKDAPWLQIVLTVSDEIIQELQVIDPLYDQIDENMD